MKPIEGQAALEAQELNNINKKRNEDYSTNGWKRKQT